MTASKVHCTIDLTGQGVQYGELQLRYSDNRHSLGYYPIPIMCINKGSGLTALLLAGVHGDEFEGPIALMRLSEQLTHNDDVHGRLIILPMLNFPAIEVSSRVSPVDQVNLNRAFPGDPTGSLSEMLAYYVEQELMPQCDYAIDLHSGGKASEFAPCSLATETEDPELFAKNLQLARAFGAPFVWKLGAFNDNRSVNSAAARKGKPMIAAELGGGGGCKPEMVDLAVAGLVNCLKHIGLIPGPPPQGQTPRLIEIKSAQQNIYAPFRALYDRLTNAGDSVSCDQKIGELIPIDPSADAVQQSVVKVVSPATGIVLAHTNRGIVERGDLLAMIATDAILPATIAWS